MPQTPKTPKRTLSYGTPGTPAKKRKVNKTLKKPSTGAMYIIPSTSNQFTRKNLRFCMYQTLTTGIGSLGKTVYRANSLYDPDQSGVGHQPRGFDQWMLLYNKFVVTRAKITVLFSQRQNVTNERHICGVQVSSSPNASNELRDYCESRMVSYKGLQSQEPQYVTQVWDLKEWKRSNVMSDDDTHGNSSSNPLEEWYFNVFLANMENSGAAQSSVQLFVTIDYEATFFDPVDPAIS